MMRRWIAIVLVAAPAAMTWAAEPAVRVEAVTIGYDGRYRPGHLTPVTVTVTNGDPEPFDGELRAQQVDDDGERLTWRAPMPVSGRSTKAKAVYVCPPPGSIESGRVAVRLMRRDGEAVATVNLGRTDQFSRELLGSIRRSASLPGEGRVIGVIGASAGALAGLVQPAGRTNSSLNLSEKASVVTVGLERMPTQWQGLDTFDVLAWDNPSADALSPDQWSALDEWVQRGGQLLMMLGSDAGGFGAAANPAAELLPVRVRRVGESTENLHELGQALLGKRYADGFAGPYPLVAVEPGEAASVLARDEETGLPMAVRGARGAGGVTVLCTSSRESNLANHPQSPALMAALVGLHAMPGQAGPAFPPFSITRQMFTHLDASGVGVLLVSIVVLLCLAYALVAGPGVWWFLRVRDRPQWAWWTFAAVVIAASLLAVAMSMLTFSPVRLSNALIVDVPANSSYGVVRGYVGLYVPTHRRVNLHAVDDPDALLMPMIDAEREPAAGYPDPQSYTFAQDDMTRVVAPVRRTIKRFRLCWQGDVDGRCKGMLRRITSLAEPARSEPVPAGHLIGAVENTFPVALEEPILLFRQPDGTISVATLRTIPAGGRLEIDTRTLVGTGNGSRRSLWSLVGYQRRVGERLGLNPFALETARPSLYDQAVLLTTLSRAGDPTSDQDDIPLARYSLGRWDRSDQLAAGKVILMGRLRDYNPASLEADGRRLDCRGPVILRVLFDVQ